MALQSMDISLALGGLVPQQLPGDISPMSFQTLPYTPGLTQMVSPPAPAPPAGDVSLQGIPAGALIEIAKMLGLLAGVFLPMQGKSPGQQYGSVFGHEVSNFPGVPEPKTGVVKQWHRLVTGKYGNYFIYFFRMSDGHTMMYNPIGRVWKHWRDYKSIVIGKSLTSKNVKAVSRRLHSHAKALSSALAITTPVSRRRRVLRSPPCD